MSMLIPSERPTLTPEMLPIKAEDQKLPLSAAFAEAPLATNPAIDNLFKQLTFAGNQLEIQEKKTGKFAQFAQSEIIKLLCGQLEENKALQLVTVQQQGMLDSQKTLHERQISQYEEKEAHYQNEIAKLSRELLETKREAEKRIEQTIKEKEAAVLAVTATSKATIEALKLEQQSLWINHLQFIKTELAKSKSSKVNLYVYNCGHLRDAFEPFQTLVRKVIYDKVDRLFTYCRRASGIKFGYSTDPWNITPAEPQ